MDSRSLVGDMKKIFGVGFGGAVPVVEDAQTEIGIYLSEAKKNEKRRAEIEKIAKMKQMAKKAPEKTVAAKTAKVPVPAKKKATKKPLPTKGRPSRQAPEKKPLPSKSGKGAGKEQKKALPKKVAKKKITKKTASPGKKQLVKKAAPPKAASVGGAAPEKQSGDKQWGQVQKALQILKRLQNAKKDQVPKAQAGGGEGKKAGERGTPQSGMGASAAPAAAGGVTSSGGKKHDPFKRSPNLGKGPGTPPGFSGTGPRYHDQEKCWNCTCGDIYTQGCKCIGTGASDDCPSGKIKKVKIKKSYRKAYNDMYHQWRDEKGGEITKRTIRRGAAASAASNRGGA